MRVEVLAPAGSAEAAQAAVRGGADAVYLGYGEFNARRHAKNFTLGELTETVRFCHENRVAVHAALNTLVFESEKSRALQTAYEAAEAGADAFIVQDLGLARLLSRELPEVPLHASTQLSVHNAAGVRFLAEQGFSRVVLAREMTREEIALVRRENPETELEAFVHGALCMSVSGQCWFSAFLGGRSGNRGLCAQTCRLPFSCAGKANALSLKDLSLVPLADELISAGVCSLKIEGRMKRPEYVAIASRAVRNAVDGVRDAETESLLRDVFSRSGFTDGYFTNHRGSEMFGVRTKEDAVSSDALGRINALTRNVCPRLPLCVSLSAHRGAPLSLSLTENGRTVTVTGDSPDEARTPQELSRVKEALSRFGGTPYFAEKITLDAEENLFLPVSVLNDLRRRATRLLQTPLHRESKPPVFVCEAPPFSPRAFTLRAEEPKQLSEISSPCDVILPLETLSEDTVAALLARGHRVLAELPRFLSPEKEESTGKRLAEAKQNGVIAAFCGNVSHIPLAQRASLIPVGSFGLNVANSDADAALKEAGVSCRTLSLETPLAELNRFASAEHLLFAYGRVPVMLVRNCPLSGKNGCADCATHRGGTLTDRKNERFPVLCRHGYAEIVNSRPLWLADKKIDLAKLLYFTTETAAEVKAVQEAYENGLPCNGLFTRGLYFK